MRNQYLAGLRAAMRFEKMADGVPMTKEQVQQARYLAMRRGLRYLLEYTLVQARSSLTTADAMATAHHLTRPELLKDPALGRQEMERLADWYVAHPTVQEIYAFASDVFHYGEKGDPGGLARFLWDTPATKVRFALELMSLLSVESNTTMGRTMIEIDQALCEALTMLGEQPTAPVEEQGALVAAGIDDGDDEWEADWMKDDDEGDRS